MAPDKPVNRSPEVITISVKKDQDKIESNNVKLDDKDSSLLKVVEKSGRPLIYKFQTVDGETIVKYKGAKNEYYKLNGRRVNKDGSAYTGSGQKESKVIGKLVTLERQVKDIVNLPAQRPAQPLTPAPGIPGIPPAALETVPKTSPASPKTPPIAPVSASTPALVPPDKEDKKSDSDDLIDVIAADVQVQAEARARLEALPVKARDEAKDRAVAAYRNLMTLKSRQSQGEDVGGELGAAQAAFNDYNKLALDSATRLDSIEKAKTDLATTTETENGKVKTAEDALVNKTAEIEGENGARAQANKASNALALANKTKLTSAEYKELKTADTNAQEKLRILIIEKTNLDDELTKAKLARDKAVAEKQKAFDDKTKEAAEWSRDEAQRKIKELDDKAKLAKEAADKARKAIETASPLEKNELIGEKDAKDKERADAERDAGKLKEKYKLMLAEQKDFLRKSPATFGNDNERLAWAAVTEAEDRAVKAYEEQLKSALEAKARGENESQEFKDAVDGKDTAQKSALDAAGRWKDLMAAGEKAADANQDIKLRNKKIQKIRDDAETARTAWEKAKTDQTAGQARLIGEDDEVYKARQKELQKAVNTAKANLDEKINSVWIGMTLNRSDTELANLETEKRQTLAQKGASESMKGIKDTADIYRGWASGHIKRYLAAKKNFIDTPTDETAQRARDAQETLTSEIGKINDWNQAHSSNMDTATFARINGMIQLAQRAQDAGTEGNKDKMLAVSSDLDKERTADAALAATKKKEEISSPDQLVGSPGAVGSRG